jgi:hypothetical protein
MAVWNLTGRIACTASSKARIALRHHFLLASLEDYVDEGRSSKEAFAYLTDEDAYRCPAGKRLTYRYNAKEADLTTRIYWCSTCQVCLMKDKCTTGTERRVRRWVALGAAEPAPPPSRRSAHCFACDCSCASTRFIKSSALLPKLLAHRHWQLCATGRNDAKFACYAPRQQRPLMAHLSNPYDHDGAAAFERVCL